MNFVPIRLSTLRSEQDLTFDVHIRLQERFLLYVRNGDDLSSDRLQKLKGKKVKQLFIADSDEQKYQDFLDQSLINAAEDKGMASEKKAEIATGVAAGAVEDMQIKPEDVGAYKMCEKATKG